MQPFSQFKIFRGWGFGINSYGHAAVRYTMPDGTQKVMNIVGGDGKKMVTFVDPADYLFSSEKAEQRGIFNRDIVGVRIEHVAPEKILEMDAYFRALSDRYEKQDAKFNIAFGPFFNLFRDLMPRTIVDLAERGNCAMYTSKGLKIAGVIKHWSMYVCRTLKFSLFFSSFCLCLRRVCMFSLLPLHAVFSSFFCPSFRFFPVALPTGLFLH